MKRDFIKVREAEFKDSLLSTLQAIFLVGGLGANVYLYQRVQELGRESKVVVQQPLIG